MHCKIVNNLILNPIFIPTASLSIYMSYYENHVFFCLNEREDGRPCCADRGAKNMQEYAKQRIKSLNLNGQGKCRINKAGCLDRCEEGPVLVVYPQAIWYTFVDEHDIDEIIETHIVGGKIVERLQLK